MTPGERAPQPALTRLSRRALVIGGAGIAGVGALGRLPAAAATTSGMPDPGSIVESTVFEAGEAGLDVFHVFGLTATTRASLLAFAEGRIARSDAGPHHIVGRRSTDGGRTWGELQYVRRSDGVQAFVNPTPLLDQQTGRIFLFFSEGFRNPGNRGGSPDSSTFFVVHSDDDGLSWSEPTELTSLFDGNPHEWTLHMSGPGHGIQLVDGRLLMQVWHRRAVAFPVAERRYGASVVYSDDHGATWHSGGSVGVDGLYPLNECRLIERPDGTIAMLGRYASGGIHPRIASISADRGQTWSDPVLDASARPVNAVDTGLARVTGEPGSDRTSRVVFSRPDSPTRRNLTVSLSYDECMTWSYSRVLTDGPASYSDVVAMPDGGIGVLYGRDQIQGSQTLSARVAFASFDLAWLTRGADTGADVRPTYHGYEVEDLPVSATPGIQARVVDDDAASAGRRLELAATDYGNYLEVGLDLPHGGIFDLHVRFRHLINSGVAEVAFDGVRVGGPVDTSTVTVRSFKTERLGRVRTTRGRHTLRFTVVDKHVDSSGLRISPDLVTFVPARGDGAA